MQPIPPLLKPALSSRVPARRRQGGATLLVVVSLLLALGLMGITGMMLSRGQFQLAGNLQHQQLAFVEADTAIAVAEKWLSDPANAESAAFSSYSAAAKGLYPKGKLTALGLEPKTMAWTGTNSIAAGGGRYLIEQLEASVILPGSGIQVGQTTTGACKRVSLFRIVAQSSSTRGASRTIETFYATDACN